MYSLDSVGYNAMLFTLHYIQCTQWVVKHFGAWWNRAVKRAVKPSGQDKIKPYLFKEALNIKRCMNFKIFRSNKGFVENIYFV